MAALDDLPTTAGIYVTEFEDISGILILMLTDQGAWTDGAGELLTMDQLEVVATGDFTRLYQLNEAIDVAADRLEASGETHARDMLIAFGRDDDE